MSTETDTEVLNSKRSSTSGTWVHLGYYVRRTEGQLVLVQTFLVSKPDNTQSEVRMAYLSLEDLESAWAEAVAAQGEDLEEGKSREFIPPDEDFDDDYSDDEEALTE